MNRDHKHTTTKKQEHAIKGGMVAALFAITGVACAPMLAMHTTSVGGVSVMQGIKQALTPQVSAASQTLGVSAINIKAGENGILSTSLVDPGTQVMFIVEKPTGETISFREYADDTGVAKGSLSSSYTQQAGVYIAQASSFGYESRKATFIVSPGPMDANKSTLEAAKNLLSKESTTKITAILQDKFGNPLRGRGVSLVSSRTSDNITPITGSNQTNNTGKIEFSFVPMEEGESIISLVDLVTGQVLDIKESISAYNPFKNTPSGSSASKSVWGSVKDLFAADITTTGDGLSIEGLAASVRVGEALSPEIIALEDGYMGTISFSSSDMDALLPVKYDFQQLDAGSHTFTYGLVFKTEGTQRLKVQDVNDPSMQVEAIIEVLPANGSNTNTASAGSNTSQNIYAAPSDDIQITAPKNRAHMRDREIDIIGFAPPNKKVKVFDQGRQIGEVSTNESGSFFLTTELLSEGNHSFNAAVTMNGEEHVSEKIEVMIDATPPLIMDVSFIPESPEVEDDVIIIVRTNEEAQVANMTIDGKTFALERTDEKNNYTGIFHVSKEGNTSIALELGDEIGNVQKYQKAATLVVLPQEKEVANQFEIQKNTDANSVSTGENNKSTLDLSGFEGQFDLDIRFNPSGLIMLWDDISAPAYDAYMAAEGAEYSKMNTEPINDVVYIYTGSLYQGNTLFRIISQSQEESYISNVVAVEVGDKGEVRVINDYQPLKIGAVGREVEGKGLLTQQLIPTIPFMDIIQGKLNGAATEKPKKAVAPTLVEPTLVNPVPTEPKQVEVATPKEINPVSFAPQEPTIPEPQELEPPQEPEEEAPAPVEDDLVDSGPTHIFLLGMGLVLIGIIYEGVWAVQVAIEKKKRK